jgi:putative glutamine amidotransferase
MSNRPIIGITTDTHKEGKQYESPFAYAAAVDRAGGLPVLLPYRVDLAVIPQLVDRLDGVLFTGGNDLDPAAYGETYVPGTVPVDPLRETFERALMAVVEQRRTPTLGICMGSQLMNIYREGSLVQFLPAVERANAIEHRRLGETATRHAISLVAGSAAARAIGKTEILGNTSHKQAVATVGKGLRVIATSPDGVIEGVEDPSFPLWLGVQWHPERLIDEADHLALFTLLVEKSRK